MLYPLLFEPIYKEKPWGGRALEGLGRRLPGDADTPVGESWEVADLDRTSPTGGGGEPAHSRIRNGPLAGRTLGDLIREFPDALLGDLPLSPEGKFPLLVKFLDARENLSIQVHPSEAWAASHPSAHLKSEAWYIIDAHPGAVIYKGVVAGTSVETFRAAIMDGSVKELLIEVPAKSGDCHYLPSGTCHALGAGILVAEVQTPSDTTFRVYDWGRKDRELHIDEALASIQYGPAQTSSFEPRDTRQHEGASQRTLVRCEHFDLDALHAKAGYREDLIGGSPKIWMILRGSGRIHWGEGGSQQTELNRGETILLPAGIELDSLEVTEDMDVLRVAFPKTRRGA